jgi:hypothetical protein
LERRQKRRIAEGTLAKDKAVPIKRVFGSITAYTATTLPTEEQIQQAGTLAAIRAMRKL